eukprot:TRINITY_DN13402_c0_g1_i1.p1 TRINITY_DN13402_c0_g1~~TRINITY_DN13402_c0_g1_i1.p1  ORF type:complete len:603 (+),score=134.67 TRINITY_DN13402_c0_g1_i1:88-1809(+)
MKIAGEGPMTKHQTSLPRLPIPSLDETCARYVQYVAPLLPAEKLERTRKAVEEFRTGAGIDLQRQLQVYNRGVTSYIADFWNDAYLNPRDPVPINVNPYLLLQDEAGAHYTQAGRAGTLLSATGEYTQKVRSRTLAPDMEKTTAYDMSQHDILTSTARIPRVRRDVLTAPSNARHVAVFVRNRVYKLDILDNNGAALPARQLTGKVQEILSAARAQSAGPPIGVLTAEQRTRWSLLRPLLDPKLLKTIDDAIIVLCLDEPQSTDIQHVVKQMLHSDCRNRWFDKTVQLIVSAEGKAAVNMEHSGPDGHTLLRYCIELQESAKNPTASGRGEAVWSEVKVEVSDPDLVSGIQAAEKHADALVAANKSHLIEWKQWGKNFVKSGKMSPDAVMQMAFQLAYYRFAGEPACTYESCMTKHFLHGRTEAIRSVTQDSVNFTKIATTPDTSLSDVRAALGKAAAAHVARAGECRNGYGVDRHLYALACLGKELGVTPEIFKDEAWSVLNGSVISTSNVSSDYLHVFGFGPVVPNGLGIGYIIKDDELAFHVTSKQDSLRKFTDNLEGALNDIHKALSSK